MKIPSRSILLALILPFTAVLAGCGDDPLAPFEPEVGNLPGAFELQATNVSDLTRTLTYTWASPGTVANVNHSTTTTGGAARLRVTAADGSTVYDETLVASLNEQTAEGPAGDWTVRVVLTGYTGTLNFRLETP